MDSNSVLSAKRKSLALSGVAAAAAVLSSQSDADAQGVYQYSQFFNFNTSVTTGRGNPNGSQLGNSVAVSLPGLKTVQPLDAVVFSEVGQITFSQCSTNNSVITSYTMSVNFSGYLQLNINTLTLNDYVGSSGSSSSIGNNIFGTSCRTYFWLSGQGSSNTSLAPNVQVGDYAYGQGNYGNISGLSFDILDTEVCGGGAACQNWFAAGGNVTLGIKYVLGAVPGPSSAAVLLPGLIGSLTFMRLRRRSDARRNAA